MHFSLDVLRARKGDCLMLHFGDPEAPHLILIDGGPSSVYKPQMKPRIDLIRKARELETNDPLPIDVIMVSHIDDDHIRGILELTAEQRLNSPDQRLAVTSLWHNMFDDFLTVKPEQLPILGQASLAASTSRNDLFADVEPEDEEVHQTIEVLASIPQGRQLRDDRVALQAARGPQQWRLNHKFGGKLITATSGAQPVTFDGGLKITVAGPMQPELEALREAQQKWVNEHKDELKKNPEAMLAAFVDTSVPNLSSIVLFAELKGKSMLLTGDARGDKILTGLELSGVLAKDGERHIDILKVPHHGSDNNMEPIFFKRLPADHYVFSGDGEHGNPERNTLQMLLDARGPDASYKIHLTYSLKEIDEAREDDWNKERGEEEKRKAKNPKKEVREEWSKEEHSLEAFFDKTPKMAAKLSFVEKAKPHVIDLLDPVSLKPA